MAVLSAVELEEQLQEMIRRLRVAFSPVAIYLFGSYAYGRPGAGSDVDLLVVVEESPLDPFSRDARAYRALAEIPVPVDVQVYTREEFERRASLPVSFERTVRHKGRIVYAA